MDDAVVSQEEIDALLGGDAGGGGSSDNLTDNEKDAIGEISNISMGTAATTLSTLVNNKVVITTPTVSISDLGTVSKAYDRPCVFIQIGYIEGLDGKNVLILKENDVKIITDLMMGGDGTNLADELSDLHLSAICEAMNQMMGSASTSLSSMLEKKVDISPPTASLLDLNDSISAGEASEDFDFLDGEFVMVNFRMQIGDLIDSQIMQLYSFEFAKDLYNKFMGESAEPEPEPTPPPAPAAAPTPAAAPAPEQAPQMQPQPMPQMQMQPQPMPMPMPMYAPMDYNVQPAQFQSFNPAMQPLLQQENIDLILDVPLEVSVELGRTNKTIKEILDFQQGSIIELNRLAGEPIDVLVNGKFVAKGEVVVIEENFGIRVTEIIK